MSAAVVVVGGGAIGRSIAFRCAQQGMDVTVVSPPLVQAASFAAAGLLAPVTEVHYGERDLLHLGLASARMYPSYIAELEDATGLSAGYRQCGTVVVARDRDENEALEDLYRFQLGLSLEVQRLRSRELRALEPALAPTVRGGMLVEGDHQVDNRALLDVLASACDATGVRDVPGRVREVTVCDKRVTGVRLQDGDRIGADVVVLAAGCWSSEVGGLPAEAAPRVRPVKGQLLHLRDRSGRAPITRNVRGLDVYIVPRADGRVVVGATVEEQGFDDAVTAEAVYTLLRDAYELMPGIMDLELTETVVGFRPGSPDNAPLLGWSSVQGLALATGHHRNGILLAPVTAEAIAELIATGRPNEAIRAFSPERFHAAVAT